MATVFIPPAMRDLTDGADTVRVAARTVRDAIEELDRRFPGISARLLDGHRLKPGLCVAVDDHVEPLGLFAKLREDSEVHFLPAIGGG
ncbi:MAG: MoaD/ThiS family protein [Planctomycetota bacterium]|nr:MAG: MoaD/ThiS family protein [Planctomycetota bacterium]